MLSQNFFTHFNIRRWPVVAVLSLTLFATGGCGVFTNVANIGKEPKLSKIQNPLVESDYEPITLPMPSPEPVSYSPNSLWRNGARGFFRDQRARRIGDILTINILIEDSASLSNNSSASRTSSEDVKIPALAGFETQLVKQLPAGALASQLLDTDGSSSHAGVGAITRNESISLKIAAVVTQIMPNGNFVVMGRQEVRVNRERRDLSISGVIRPEDISSINTIDYEKIAEARISYGGQGQISNVQQPRYGHQIIEAVSPF